jgi:hypothetical protein
MSLPRRGQPAAGDVVCMLAQPPRLSAADRAEVEDRAATSPHPVRRGSGPHRLSRLGGVSACPTAAAGATARSAEEEETGLCLGVASTRAEVQGRALRPGCALRWSVQSIAPDRTEVGGGGEAPRRGGGRLSAALGA